MHYIIFDLEATCWENQMLNREQEIIEIGAVKYTRFGETLGQYQTFIRPTEYPSLSNYCTRLTGIDQDDVQNAPTFGNVIGEFLHWAEEDGIPLAYCAWGKYDRELLLYECERLGLEDEWLEPYLNLKQQYRELNRIPGRVGLKSALNRERIEFTGQHHRALDDAINLGKIFEKYIDSWMI